jgi:hypothetical protein
MKTLINFSLYFFVFLFFSCNTIENIEPIIKPQPEPIVKESISGFVQKGPFAIGTAITVAELDSTLTQSGRNFNTQITNNNGNFKINNIVLNNNIVEIKADGFYFNEVRGINSENRLTLYSLSDLTVKNTINVNVLSYLEKPRIECLVGNGKSFSEAKKQAQKEVLEIFEVEKDNIVNSEQLDISKVGEDNAVLLAVSVILQGKRTVAELSELLAKISLDIREDGILNDKNCGSELINHAKLVNLNATRSNIESKYFKMGQKDSIPDFEKVITNFIDNTDFEYTLKIEYPRSGKYGISLLSLEDGETIASFKQYSLKALMPEGFNLKVRIKQTSDNLNGGNWFYTTFPEGEVSTYILTKNIVGDMEWTTRENAIDADHVVFFDGKGSGEIEIFENNATRPTKTIRFRWDIPKNIGIIYPAPGKFGENLFMMKDDSKLESGKTYSLALALPEKMNLHLNCWIVLISGNGTFSFDKNLVENWSANISDERNVITASSWTAGIHVDMPVVFKGTGECTLELRAANASVPVIIYKHFKW